MVIALCGRKRNKAASEGIIRWKQRVHHLSHDRSTSLLSCSTEALRQFHPTQALSVRYRERTLSFGPIRACTED